MAVIDEEIAALQSKGPDAAELERAKNQIESDTVRSLEGLLARAERLQHYNLSVRRPGFPGRGPPSLPRGRAGRPPAGGATVPAEGGPVGRPGRAQPGRARSWEGSRSDSPACHHHWLAGRPPPPPAACGATPPHPAAPPRRGGPRLARPGRRPPRGAAPEAARPRAPRDAGRRVSPAAARSGTGASFRPAALEAVQAQERPRRISGRVSRPAPDRLQPDDQDRRRGQPARSGRPRRPDGAHARRGDRPTATRWPSPIRSRRWAPRCPRAAPGTLRTSACRR